MPVTLKDIAQRVGKSVTTVSRALHDYDDVSPETKAMVTRVAKEMEYSPNTLAQRLQKRRSDTIGLIIPASGTRHSDPFFSELLAGISNTAHDMGYDLLVDTKPPGEQELNAYRKMLEGRRVDGYIVARTRRHDPRINYLLNGDIPFVAFGCTEGDNPFPYVDEDGAHGMRLVAEHLVSLGHRRIACIAPDPELSFAACRVHGLRQGLSEHGIRLSEAYVKNGDLSQQSGYDQARELLNMSEPPTAIAACNDLMAFGAIRAAQERGLIVGQNIAITGFDDIPMAEHSHPPLTTVHQPVYKIGGMVCEMLIKVICEEALEQKHIILKPLLVIRQSCGGNYAKDKN